jgi:hypothetical protein
VLKRQRKDSTILRVLKFTFILLLLFTFTCSRQKERKDLLGPLVLFDAYKEQVWPIKDTGFAGYSSLNLFLQDLGFNTAENHKPYSEVLPYLDTKSTLFVVSVAMVARFTRNEVKDILDFVGRGGKLLVIAEHDNQFGSADFLRPLINAAGWEIDNGRIMVESDTFPHTGGRWFYTSLPSREKGPVLLCAADLIIIRKEGCKVFLTSRDGKHVVAGLGNYGKGQITIVTDSEFLWNSSPDYKWGGVYPLAFSDPKTRRFMRGLISGIFPTSLEKQSDDSLFTNKPEGLRKIFVYGNGGRFKNYSKFLSALNEANLTVLKYEKGIKISPEDRVIVITPLKKIPQQITDELSRSRKIVFFGDMYSSVKSYAESWEGFFKPSKIYPLPYPLNSLAEKYGVRFLPWFGVNFKESEYENFLYVPVFFKKKRLYLHKACAIEFLSGQRNREIYFENSKETFACKVGLGLGQPLVFKDPKDIENPDFLIATDNVLAIGDSDIISDDFILDTQRIGFLKMIIEFLKSES